MRSGDEGDGSSVSWGFQEAPHILFPLVLADWNNRPNLSFLMGTEQNCFLAASGLSLTGSEHSGKRPRASVRQIELSELLPALL